MIKFTAIDIHNFGVIDKASINLDSQGLVLIRGVNKDTTSASSNGSGKSTIFKALSWCLYGSTVENGRSNDSTIRRGKSKAVVTVLFENGVDKYRVARSRTKSSTKLSMYTNGSSTTGRTAKDTEKQIVEAIGLDWQSFRNTVLYGQGDIKRFADPHTSDSERKQVLKTVLGLDVYDKAKERASFMAKILKGSISTVENELGVASALLREAKKNMTENTRRIGKWKADQQKNMEECQTIIANLEQKLKSATEDTQIDDYKEKLSEVEQEMEKYEGIEVEHAKALVSLTGLQAEKTQALTELSKLKGDVHRTQRLLEINQTKLDRAIESHDIELDEHKCPTCGSSDRWGLKEHQEHIRVEIKALGDERQELIDKIAICDKLMPDCEAKTMDLLQSIVEIKEDISKLENCKRALGDLKIRQNLYKRRIRDTESQQDLSREAKARIDRYKGVYDNLRVSECPYTPLQVDFEQKVREASAEVGNAEVKLAAMYDKLEPIRWWREAFGDKGLPSMAMDAIMPILTGYSNKYLEILSDSDIKVDISTVSTLKSGKKTDSITITPTVEGLEGVALSGGQKCKIGLAVDLGLMDIVANREGSMINLLLLDEVLDGLDVEGKQRVVDLLKYLKGIRPSVFVISHDDVVQDEFEKMITVTKEGHKSTISEE